MTGQEARDNEREQLIDAMINVPGADGQVEFADDDREPAGHLADAILAAGYRKDPEPEITDEIVKAAIDRFHEPRDETWEEAMRATLGAALAAALRVPVGEGEQQ